METQHNSPEKNQEPINIRKTVEGFVDNRWRKTSSNFTSWQQGQSRRLVGFILVAIFLLIFSYLMYNLISSISEIRKKIQQRENRIKNEEKGIPYLIDSTAIQEIKSGLNDFNSGASSFEIPGDVKSGGDSVISGVENQELSPEELRELQKEGVTKEELTR